MTSLGIGIGVGVARQIYAGSAAADPEFAVAPIVWLHANDLASNGQYIPNHGSGSTPPENMLTLSGGQMDAGDSGCTFTDRFIAGPSGQQTAIRLQLNATSGAAELFNRTLPAGTYNYRFQAKLNSGSSPITLSHGNVNATQGTTSINDTAWTACTGTFTSNGSSNVRFQIRNTNGSTIDVLVDELQIYEPGDAVPDYSTEVKGAYTARLLKVSGSITKTGGAINTSGASAQMLMDTFPLNKSITEGTLMAVVSTTDTVSTTRKVMSFGTGEGNFMIGCTLGTVYGRPGMERGALLNVTDIANKGYHVLASRQKAGEQAFFIDGVKIQGDADTLGTITSAVVGVMGDQHPNSQNSFLGGGANFIGKLTQAAFWDVWLDDDQIVDATAVIRAAHLETGEVDLGIQNFVIYEGDSITIASPQVYPFQYFATHPTDTVGTIMAITGSALSHLNTRLPDLLKRIEASNAAGYHTVVSVLIGANGVPTIADLETYYAAIKGAGATLIAATLTPKSNPSFNVERGILNPQIRASVYPDAIADYDADPDIGPDAAGSDITKFPDGTHPSTATQTVMMGIWSAAYDTVKV